MFTKRIHVFKAGDQTSAQGVQRHFSDKDLQQVVDTYDPSIHEAPLVIGHSGDNDSTPAYGWIKGFSRKGENLYAEVAFTDAAKDLVKNGHYRKVSISFYSPDSLINPHKGKWSARHLALLGASPPAVKGLEPFSFTEAEGVYDFAVSMDPGDIFDDQLGPSMMVDKSPLEMLKEKLDAVREDVSSAVKDLQAGQQGQQVQNLQDSAASAANQPSETTPPSGSPDSQQYRETTQNSGREGTEIAQQTADLEDQFPEEKFMDQDHISRKRAKGAGGQVMQVVENIYEETQEKMSDEHGELPAAFAKNAQKMKAKAKQAESQEVAEDDNDEDDYSELEYDEVSYKTNPSPGVVKFGKKKVDEADPTERFETARSADNGYVDRMKTGKTTGGVGADRMKTAKSSLQDEDRMQTVKNGEQDADRMKTAKDGSDNAMGESRWAGQADGYDQVSNMDQYDAGANDYPEPNRPKYSKGTDPYGRDETDTKMPTESEEMPDDEVFAVDVNSVMSDKNMRVLRQTSSQGRQAVKGGSIPSFKEPEPAEETSELGVTAHGEGAGKPAKNKQLTPGAMDTIDDPAETVGPDGAYAESTRGEKKSKEKQLTPGAFDKVDEADQTVGPDGAYAEGKASKSKLLTPGAQDELDVPGEVSKRSGGVSDHAEGKKDPYTKTGFGSTYEESDENEDTDDEYSELSVDHCGMNYGSGQQGQAHGMGYPQQMYEELQALKQKYAELERRHAEEKIMARRARLSNFVESLYTEGRLTDGIIPEQELLSYCEGLEFGTLEFSEGETAATKLLNLLSKLPPMVAFGEYAGGSFQYAEEADLDPHSKALRMVAESDGKMDYVEALKKAMFS